MIMLFVNIQNMFSWQFSRRKTDFRWAVPQKQIEQIANRVARLNWIN